MAADRSPFANVLHTETIARLARGSAFEQGRVYAASGAVKALARHEGQLVAVVSGGGSFYAVSIWIRGDGLGFICTCPLGAEGDFCKHCVAVAVAWVSQNGAT